MQLDAAAWARVAAAHGVGRSGAECAMYYRHNLRPGLAWSLEVGQGASPEVQWQI